MDNRQDKAITRTALDQITNYGDCKQTYFCAYCGGSTGTRDHVPSRVFLDKPYPSNLPVVAACRRCNESFSLDEEYLACLIECARLGTTDPAKIERPRIKRTLQSRPNLVSRLRDAMHDWEDITFFSAEWNRVHKVVLKLARGHALYELNEPQLSEPSYLAVTPFPSIPPDVRKIFETPPMPSIFPEVGSRAMTRLVVAQENSWLIAQQGRYRYLTSVGDGAVIRFVIGEYLACEVVWNYDCNFIIKQNLNSQKLRLDDTFSHPEQLSFW